MISRTLSAPSKARHLAGALFVVLIWGISFAVTRAAVREINPLALALLRFILASIILWPFAKGRAARTPIERSDRGMVLLLGLTGVTLYFAFENVGLWFTTASHGSLIVATIPLVTACAEAVGRRTWPRPVILAGLLTALAGVWLIVGERGEGSATLLGDLLMFGAVFSWAAYTFIVRHLHRKYSQILLTWAIMIVGAVTLLPLAVAEAFILPTRWPSAAAWGAVVFLGVLCSALAYLVWNRAIVALGVTVTSNLIYGVPLVGVLAGVLALGEPFTWRVAVGGMLIMGGVAAASLRH